MTKQTPITADSATATDTIVEYIPLDQLTLSRLNPRQEVADAEIAILADSLVACGLIQNLAGLRTGKSAVAILAGGRRLRALQIAVQTRPDLASVPVKVTTEEAQALQWASVENAAREALHPVDEILAYKAMAEAQNDVTRIAQAFAVSEAHVRRRMALSGLPDAVHAALRAGEVSLGLAGAMTVSDDEEAILDVLERCKKGWVNEHSVKRWLKPDAESGTGRKARFVGLEAYKGAGGIVTTDLFEDETLLDNPDILDRLFAEKLEEAANAEQKANGWAWVETYEESSIWSGDGWYDRQKFARVYPVEGVLTEEQAERYDELADIYERDEAEEAEFDAFNVIQDGDFTEQQRRHAGAVVLVNHQGDVSVLGGLIKPEDAAAAIAAGVLEENKHTASGAGQGTTAEKPAYSQKFLDDMAAIRLAAVQTALLDKPEFVLDLLGYALWENHGSFSSALNISRSPERNIPEFDEGFNLDPRLGGDLSDEDWDAADKMEAKVNEAEGGPLAGFRSLGKKYRNAAITAEIAKCLSQTKHGGVFGDVEREVEADVRSIWTPNGSNCFNRLKGPQLEAIFCDLLDHAPDSAAAKAFAKGKKSEKVETLDGLFNDPKVQAKHGVTLEQKERIDAWLPV